VIRRADEPGVWQIVERSSAAQSKSSSISVVSTFGIFTQASFRREQNVSPTI